MIRSATFCSMPLAVCRLQYAAKYPHGASSGVQQARVRLRAPAYIFERVFPARARVQQARVRLRAPAHIFERVFPDARPRTKKNDCSPIYRQTTAFDSSVRRSGYFSIIFIILLPERYFKVNNLA